MMQNESGRNEKRQTSPPRRRSPCNWETHEPEQETASGMDVLPGLRTADASITSSAKVVSIPVSRVLG